MIGSIFNVMFFMGRFVIKCEVLKWVSFVFLIYIVVYGSIEIGEIVLLFNFERLRVDVIDEDFILIMIDVL